jgi:hypothetical protein
MSAALSAPRSPRIGAERPPLNGSLQGVPFLRREPGGLMEAHPSRALILAEDPVDGQDVEVVVGVEAGSESLRERRLPRAVRQPVRQGSRGRGWRAGPEPGCAARCPPPPRCGEGRGGAASEERAPTASRAGGAARDRSRVPRPPPCGGRYTTGTRRAFCRRMAPAAPGRSRRTERARSRGQGCRTSRTPGSPPRPTSPRRRPGGRSRRGPERLPGDAARPDRAAWRSAGGVGRPGRWSVGRPAVGVLVVGVCGEATRSRCPTDCWRRAAGGHPPSVPWAPGQAMAGSDRERGPPPPPRSKTARPQARPSR